MDKIKALKFQTCGEMLKHGVAHVEGKDTDSSENHLEIVAGNLVEALGRGLVIRDIITDDICVRLQSEAPLGLAMLEHSMDHMLEKRGMSGVASREPAASESKLHLAIMYYASRGDLVSTAEVATQVIKTLIVLAQELPTG